MRRGRARAHRNRRLYQRRQPADSHRHEPPWFNENAYLPMERDWRESSLRSVHVQGTSGNPYSFGHSEVLQIDLPGFDIGVVPVTQALWIHVMGEKKNPAYQEPSLLAHPQGPTASEVTRPLFLAAACACTKSADEPISRCPKEDCIFCSLRRLAVSQGSVERLRDGNPAADCQSRRTGRVSCPYFIDLNGVVLAMRSS